MLSIGVNSIKGIIAAKAKWIFNVKSNTNNWTKQWKNPKGNDIDYSIGKYKLSITKKNPLLYEMILEINNITWEDNGFYSLQVKAGGTAKEPTIMYMNLEVTGKIYYQSITANTMVIFTRYIKFILYHRPNDTKIY